MSPFDLTGKIALVTGASTGIGQAIAVGLAKAGADIAVAGRTLPSETAASVRHVGRKFLAIDADFSTIAPVEAVIAQVLQDLGHIDILVNNAGIIRRSEALEFSEADWDAVLNVNLKTVFFLSQAVARQMLAQGEGGKIISIASLLSFQGGIRVASYTAAKSGLAGLTRILANEWAAKGINVNAIAPGYIETKNTEALRQDRGRNRQILDRIPASHWGKPEDIAGTAVFLASRAADYVHGAIIPVDGGWLAR